MNQDYLVLIQVAQGTVRNGATGMMLKDCKNVQMVFARLDFGKKKFLGLFSKIYFEFFKLRADNWLPTWNSKFYQIGLKCHLSGINLKTFLSGQRQCQGYYDDHPQFNQRLVTSSAHGGIMEWDLIKAFVMP